MRSGSRTGFYRQAALKRSVQEGTRRLREAIAAGNNRDYRTAVSILEGIISGYEGPAESFLYLGRALHALKDHSRALAAFNDYITLDPLSPQGYFFAGRTCLVLGFYPRAVQYLEKAVDRDSANGEIIALLGTALLKARRSREALETLQRAVEAAPANHRIYRAYLNALFVRAVRVCREENYSLGLGMLRFVLENGKDGPLLRLELGRASRELGLLEEAAEHYSQALAFSPEDPMIRWYRASIYMELNRKTEAIGDISTIRSWGTNLPDLPWNSSLVDHFMINALLEEGQWRRAAEACRDWLKKRGGDPVIHAMYAEAQRNLKNYPAAENHLLRALEYEGGSLHLWYALIFTSWEGRNLKILKKALHTAGRIGGEENILSRFSVLCDSERSKNTLRVITLLQKAIHTLGPDPELMYALGKTYLKTGLLQEAENWFSKILLLQPEHEEARLGLIAAREIIFDEAGGEETLRSAGPAAEKLAAAYREYLEQWPDNRSIRRDEALFLVRICEYGPAAKKLEALLAWDPANPGLRRVLAYSYRKLGNYRSAAVYLKALLREKPRDVRLLLEYAGCIERSGGSRYARTILEKAGAYLRGSSEIPTALGLLSYREGNLEHAFTCLLNAAARNKNDPRPYHWLFLISKKRGDILGAEHYEREYRRILETSGKRRKNTC
ncbi:MAG: tetratricopeptide repeat protein [Treponema sp.]|jgi:tetratricopeptide (TPR) repeat protein|nr:tetratricopeptide repeat protein [Treponema sp.]